MPRSKRMACGREVALAINRLTLVMYALVVVADNWKFPGRCKPFFAELKFMLYLRRTSCAGWARPSPRGTTWWAWYPQPA